MGLKKSLLQAFLAILLFLAASGAYASDVVISRSYGLFPGPGRGTAGAFIGTLDPETIIVDGQPIDLSAISEISMNTNHP